MGKFEISMGWIGGTGVGRVGWIEEGSFAALRMTDGRRATLARRRWNPRAHP